MAVYTYQGSWTQYCARSKEQITKLIEDNHDVLARELEEKVKTTAPENFKELDNLNLSWFYPMSINMWYTLNVAEDVTFTFLVDAYDQMLRQIFDPPLRVGEFSVVSNSHIHATCLETSILEQARERLADTQKQFIDIGCGMRQTPDFQYMSGKGIIKFLR